uniref:Translation initiation factor IF-2 n=1 Tax=Anthurium amnicola TaxID=1678845 RepID=A0A1D1XTB4_9ARAE
MKRTKLEMILFFMIFSFLFTFPFQSMAQAPAAPAPAPGTPPAPAPAPAPAPGTTPPGTTPGTSGTPGTTPGAAASPPVVTRCNVNTFTTTTVPFKQLKNSLSGGGAVSVSGTVTITDGCTFTVNGFTYSTAAPNTYWMGSNSTDPNSTKIVVCNIPVGQFVSQAAKSFTLSPTVSFDDFDVLDLYSYDEKAVFAQAVLKTPPSPTTTTQSAASSTTKSNANRLPMSSNIMAVIICALVTFSYFI